MPAVARTGRQQHNNNINQRHTTTIEQSSIIIQTRRKKKRLNNGGSLVSSSRRMIVFVLLFIGLTIMFVYVHLMVATFQHHKNNNNKKQQQKQYESSPLVPDNNNDNNKKKSLKQLRFGTTKTTGAKKRNEYEGSSGRSLNSTKPKLTIFYHVFMPIDTSKSEKWPKIFHHTSSLNALRIIKEQLHQVKTSYAATSGTYGGNNITLYYVTIGQDGILTPELMSQPDYCGSVLKCQHLAHYDSGYEEKTLQHIHSYCSSNSSNSTSASTVSSSNNDRVIYMHSKGTFHNWKDDTNEHWRQHMTAAITSEQCLGPHATDQLGEFDNTATRSAGPCDACGLTLMSAPVVIYSGNMWVADCNYVRKLLPLDRYETTSRNNVLAMNKLTQQGKLTKLLYHNTSRQHQPKRPFMYGLDRYLAENWIGSHPHFNPCDVSPIANGTAYWRTHSYNDKLFVWSYAPRMRLFDLYDQLYPEINKTVMLSEQLRAREFFLLPGLLIKYYQNYRKLPSTTTKDGSWVWDHYPDGELWRQRIVKYGAKKALMKFIYRIE